VERLARLRDPFVATIVGLSLTLLVVLFAWLAPVVPQSFSGRFQLMSAGEAFTVPPGTIVQLSWSVPPGDNVTVVVLPSGGSSFAQHSGSSATFEFLATQSGYRIFATQFSANHDASFDWVSLNGSFAAPLLWSIAPDT